MPASHDQSNRFPTAEVLQLLLEQYAIRPESASSRGRPNVNTTSLDKRYPQAGEVGIGLSNVDLPWSVPGQATPSTSDSSRGFSPLTPPQEFSTFGLSPASDLSSPPDRCKQALPYDAQFTLQAGPGSATSSGSPDDKLIPERAAPAMALGRGSAMVEGGLQQPVPRSAPGSMGAFAQPPQMQPPQMQPPQMPPSTRAQFPPVPPPARFQRYPSHMPDGRALYRDARPTQYAIPHEMCQGTLPAPQSTSTAPFDYQGNPQGLPTPQPQMYPAAARGYRPHYAETPRHRTHPYYPAPHDITARQSLSTHRGPVPPYLGQMPPNCQPPPDGHATQGYAPLYSEQPLPETMAGIAGSTVALPAYGSAPAFVAAEQHEDPAGPQKRLRAPGTRSINGRAARSLVAKAGIQKAERIPGVKARSRCQIGNCTAEEIWTKVTLGNHIKEAHPGCLSGSAWKCQWVAGCGEDNGYNKPCNLGKHILKEHFKMKYPCVCGKEYTDAGNLKKHFRSQLKKGEDWHHLLVKGDDDDEEQEQKAGPST